MKFQAIGAVLLGVAFLTSPARAGVVTINFDGPSFNNFVPITNQFDDVTFSAGGGDIVMISTQNPPYMGSAPNLICTGTAAIALTATPANLDCTHDVILTFATPADNLNFTAFGNQTPTGGTFALVNVFFASGAPILNMPLTVSHTVHCAGPALDCAGDPQSLSFTGITQVVIHSNTDMAGTAYDDFSFSYAGGVGGVPEPSTFVLTGLCGIFWTGRRYLTRKSRKSA